MSYLLGLVNGGILEYRGLTLSFNLALIAFILAFCVLVLLLAGAVFRPCRTAPALPLTPKPLRGAAHMGFAGTAVYYPVSAVPAPFPHLTPTRRTCRRYPQTRPLRPRLVGMSATFFSSGVAA